MREIREKDNWIQELESRLEKKVYITIDLDCLDPSVMPAVGTPEPGGLLCCELLDALSQTAEKHEIIGFDVVELSPIAGLVYPDVTAARIVSKMIAYIYRSVLK
jgi:agmatinase